MISLKSSRLLNRTRIKKLSYVWTTITPTATQSHRQCHPLSRQFSFQGKESLSSLVGCNDSTTTTSTTSTLLTRNLLVAATVFGLGMVATTDDSSTSTSFTHCSGILGVVGKEGSSRDYFLQGLTVLQQRGYDGIGIVSTDNKEGGLVITKHAVLDGPDDKKENVVVSLIQEHYTSHSSVRPTGMAHTRWATHGAKMQESNVHPHLDATGKIALVHNGSLINARELRDELKGMGYNFQGQTDSEVLAKLIGHYYSQKDTISVKEATEKALRRCIGTWGLCVLCSDEPDELVVACHGSPLYIGLGDDRIYVASEVNAFSRFTKNYIAMKDGEIGVLDADGRTLDLSRKEESIIQAEDEDALPYIYPHWTLKEILEQPSAVARALGFGARLSWEKVYLGGLDSNVDILKKIQHITLLGSGSSLQAAKYGERLFKHLTAVPGRISSIDAADVEYCDFSNSGDPSMTAVIALSQSGETADVKQAVSNALGEGFTTLGVVNVVGSVISRLVKMGVYCHAGNEYGVASTKSFTSQVTVMALIALWFREIQDQMQGKTNRPSVEAERLKDALLRLPISLGMALKTREQCKRIAARLSEKEHCFVLGKGFGEPIAYEGALKMKEISNLHAEGYSGGALKHGPFALIDDETNGKFGATPIIMLVLDDQHAQHMRTACEEVKARGADLIIITDKPELAKDLDDDPIIIPTNDVMTALVALMPLQLIAYEMSILRGNNPDRPRNLAKYFR